MTQRFTFDGKGINDAADPYRARVATLTDRGHKIGAGPVLAAAGTEPVNAQLLAALKGARLMLYAWRGDRENLDVKHGPHTALLREIADIEAIIAEAEAQAKPDAPSYGELLDASTKAVDQLQAWSDGEAKAQIAAETRGDRHAAEGHYNAIKNYRALIEPLVDALAKATGRTDWTPKSARRRVGGTLRS